PAGPLVLPRGQGLAVGREGDDAHLTPWQPAAFPAGGHVPKVDRLVGARRGERLAVRQEGHGGHEADVPLDPAKFFSRGQIPQADLLTLPRSQELAIWGKGDRGNLFVVPLEAAQFFPRGRVAEMEGVPGAPPKKGFGVRAEDEAGEVVRV